MLRICWLSPYHLRIRSCCGLIDFMFAAPESWFQLSGSVTSFTPSTKQKIEMPYGNATPMPCSVSRSPRIPSSTVLMYVPHQPRSPVSAFSASTVIPRAAASIASCASAACDALSATSMEAACKASGADANASTCSGPSSAAGGGARRGSAGARSGATAYAAAPSTRSSAARLADSFICSEVATRSRRRVRVTSRRAQ